MKPTQPGNASLQDVIHRAHRRMAAVAIALAGVLLLIVGVVTLRLYLENNLHLLARSLAYTAEASLVFGDRDEAARVMEQLLRGEGVAHARIQDAHGRPFAQWSAHAPVVTGLGEVLAAGIGLPQGEAEVRQDGRLVGRVVLASDGVGLVRFLGAGLVVLALCVGISGYVGLRQSRRMLGDIAEPLQQLARVARAVRYERSMEQRVPPARIAELRELGDDFNALLAELQVRHERLEQQNSVLERQASRDSLTGLANRLHFEQRLQQALDSAGEAGQQLAVLFLDNDRFKQVNDRYGHAVGDVLLRAVGDRLRRQVRETDLVARLGGDEFAILLSPVGGAGDALHVMDKIQTAMCEPLPVADGVVLQPSVSAGLAVFPRHGQSMQALMHHADQAMYEAKAARARRGGQGQQQSEQVTGG
ncbi:Probable diguanylate cyclase YfiN [Delftia tsuruhatensis]|uniref:sensor domain-containing diguanylate cyclase n=1 Tax=Delftia tsuruhatensis TaxID=180282 RepID=UPI001E75A5CB|nr:sensor domain-containing diguanylate cyclase [Delftia tsuruhatensis]CAB5709519.1 Probable diguanylate cyclase YfiN [Delftia tsuruhatensis]CAC9685269.1 Probable diguanylate cyclase YfiN [Delftia tsuruhatensis]